MKSRYIPVSGGSTLFEGNGYSSAKESLKYWVSQMFTIINL